MASARAAWGIDIGNRALKAVKLVRDGDALRVDDFELIEHEHVLSNAGDNRESLIQTSLANFVQRHQIKKTAVAVGVSGQQSFARFIKLPPVEPKKIPEIVKFEAIQQIPFPLDDVEWAYQLFQNPESPDVEVGIFAMRKDLISRYIQFFTDVDLNVQAVQMNPLAVYNSVYYDQRLKGTTMVIDLGAENTDLIICDNDSVWMRSIPIGGNNFTETLVKAFKLPFAKAEDLKRNAATSKYARQIFQAMRPVFADLVAEIQRSVGFFASVHRDSRIKKIIALGGTFRLPGLQKYLQQNLSLDVERLDTIAAGAPADPKLAATFNENLLSVISAYGLAVQALGEGKITSSLLPASIRREKTWKEKTPIFAAAAATFCIGTGIALGGYFFQNTKLAQAAEEQRKITGIKSEASRLDGEWTTIQGSGENERKVIANILGLQDGRDTWRDLLHDIQDAIPKPSNPDVAQGLRTGDISLIKKVDRKDRDYVTIRSMISRYQLNVTKFATMGDSELMADVALNAKPAAQLLQEASTSAFGSQDASEVSLTDASASPDPAAATATGASARGFVIVIEGTSPFKNANALIESKLLKAMEKIGPTTSNPTKPYRITKARMLSTSSTIKDNPARLKELEAAFNEAGRRQAGTAAPTTPGRPASPFGGAPAAPANAAGPVVADKPEYLDRMIPDETVVNDFDFTVVLAVELAPAAGWPAAPATPAQASAQ